MRRPGTSFVVRRRAGGVLAALMARGGAAGIQLLLSLAVGRVLGPAGAGAFYLCSSWYVVLAAVGGLGYPTWALRTIAVLVDEGRQAEARRRWRSGMVVTGITTAAFGIVLTTLHRPFSILFLQDSSSAYVLVLAGWIAVAYAPLLLSAETLKALERPNAALILQFGMAPALTLAYTVLVEGTGRLTPVALLWALAVATAAALAVTALLVMRAFRLVPSEHERRPVDLVTPLPETLRFWVVNLLTQLTSAAPFLVLPYFAPQSQIGLYGAAGRLVALAALILIAISSIYAPLLATAYARRSSLRLLQYLRETQAWSLAAYAPLFVVFVVVPRLVLSAFGPDFANGAAMLVVLAMGQLVNSATGTVTFFNLMTAQERFESIAGFLSLAFFGALTVALAPRQGALGVAVAAAGTSALKNLASYTRARRTIALLGRGSMA